MTKFKLDINKSIQYEDLLGQQLKTYSSKSDETYMYVENVTKNWTDPASQIFERITLQNEQTSKDIRKSLDAYLKNAKHFSSTLKTLFTDKEYYDEELRLKYDTPYLTQSLDNASSIKDSLAEAVSIFSSLTVPSSFYMLGSINSAYNAINSCLNRMNTIKEDLSEIKIKVENLLIDTETTHKGINLVYEDRKVTSFVWQIMPPKVPAKPQMIQMVAGAKVGDVVSAAADQAVLIGDGENVKEASDLSTSAETAETLNLNNNEITYNNLTVEAERAVLVGDNATTISPETMKTGYEEQTTVSNNQITINEVTNTATIDESNITKTDTGNVTTTDTTTVSTFETVKDTSTNINTVETKADISVEVKEGTSDNINTGTNNADIEDISISTQE